MEPSDEREGYLSSVLIGGREPVNITIVSYDEDWPNRFRAVRARLRSALGPTALRIEHIGSTAVRGLAAKPIIDVLVTVDDVADETSYVPALATVGFELRVREEGHRMLRTASKDVHVHVYEPTDQAVRDRLDFRDRLREDTSDRSLYARTKQALADQPWQDMNDYADAKSQVILDILSRARSHEQDVMLVRTWDRERT